MACAPGVRLLPSHLDRRPRVARREEPFLPGPLEAALSKSLAGGGRRRVPGAQIPEMV